MNVEIPEPLRRRLAKAAVSLGKTEPECVLEALQEWLDEVEDARAYLEALEEWERDGRKTVSLEELRESLRGGRAAR